MKTTLQKIWDKNPCCKYDESGGWGLLTKNIGTDDFSAAARKNKWEEIEELFIKHF